MIMYPMYMKSAETRRPEALVAASNVGKAAPIIRKHAVIAMADAKMMIQNVKKADAVVSSPTIKYMTIPKCVIWNSINGMSVAIWAMTKAAG